ncbi:MAG: hypothetical protein HRU38_12330 [Saccharospirillaceae bacterium]|nr:hypothetical protein [Pseudomonadales bacterium]NRB79435.1 hypothetical protein [Saccharospirillaceae bacterium]
MSDTETQMIDGLEIEKYEMDIFALSGEKIINQLMYSRLINGFDFSININ